MGNMRAIQRGLSIYYQARAMAVAKKQKEKIAAALKEQQEKGIALTKEIIDKITELNK